ncbi:hypothetical protein [Rosistilla oblonga]|uniref:hypothetical protein n=1 Tax=Rosistilla oblonga TaxID=2527990 RepID=UPI003A969425
MDRAPISVFTPSNTDPEQLERIFVQRHRLLGKIVERLRRSMLTGDMYHVLLIGPRGSGKTNMVALAHHRLTQPADLKDCMRVAWLGEDDAITGLIDLALGIADRLAEEYPGEFDADYRTRYRGLPGDDAAEAILDEINQRLQHRYLWVLLENMDAAFKGMGDQGQKRWRAFLQEKGRIATLATSQQIFDGVSDREQPFWGFFDIHHLRPLSIGDARELIRNISVENGNHDLAKFLETADGRYRIRSLHHLAGGNHRMYVLLSEFLTKESLDDLVAAFETLADELTPYFQERIRSLPAQQAKIVQSLAAMEGAAITVKEIARLTFIDDRSCSKQLGELRNKNYVQSEKRGKESYYELAEPLMRLCLEVKNQRGKPLRLIARFLKAWFTNDDLKSQLELNLTKPSRTDAYRETALALDSGFKKVLQSQIDREIGEHLQRANYEGAFTAAEELECADPLFGRLRLSQIKWQRGDLSGAIDDLTFLIETSDTPLSLKANALLNRGMSYGQQGNAEKELADYTSLIKMPDAPMGVIAYALEYRGAAYRNLGEATHALADYTMLLALPSIPAALEATALLNRGVIYGQLEEKAKELADFTRLIEMPDAPVDRKAMALLNRGVVYRQLSDSNRALSDFSALIERADTPEDQRVAAFVNRGATYQAADKSRKASADYMSVVEMPTAKVSYKIRALSSLSVLHWRNGAMSKSLATLQQAERLAPVGSEDRCHVMFAIPEPLMELASLNEVVTALRRAFAENAPDREAFGGTPEDLFWMVLRRGCDDWERYVAALLPLYVEFEAAEVLGRGVTQLIGKLDAGDYTRGQLDYWNSIWQERGAAVEALELPLKCLAAATEAIKTKSDRPLFALPQEIRSLVRSLLTSTLGPVDQK